ncbi:unnamed protein product [Sphenostylis stenocarpa]|uniref:Uncharacterized protein n=1 Tax=Sphenostylis stenocarpa TaxID=92480 RepID=A0AA86S468_9FABA|nr:unnamed protein product [Sphenostylis stenocarpa]
MKRGTSVFSRPSGGITVVNVQLVVSTCGARALARDELSTVTSHMAVTVGRMTANEVVGCGKRFVMLWCGEIRTVYHVNVLSQRVATSYYEKSMSPAYDATTS